MGAMLDRTAFDSVVREGMRMRLVPTDHAIVLALHGDLGAGKTTFTQILARELGVTETVTSPTFVIMKTYQTTDPWFTTLVHIDAYRLKNSRELMVLGWDEILVDPHTIVCIEWPERVEDSIPGYAHHVSLSFVDETHRTIRFD